MPCRAIKCASENSFFFVSCSGFNLQSALFRTNERTIHFPIGIGIENKKNFDFAPSQLKIFRIEWMDKYEKNVKHVWAMHGISTLSNVKRSQTCVRLPARKNYHKKKPNT